MEKSKETVTIHLTTKILFGFLLVTENRYQCRSFIKAKWRLAKFKKFMCSRTGLQTQVS